MTPDRSSEHRRAIVLMLCAAALWSTAGVVTRNLSAELQTHGRFEIVLWRSAFAVLFIAGYHFLVARRGLAQVLAVGWPGLLSGAMWCVMFSCFMLALTLTSVGNTLIVMSLGPFATALLARLVLGAPIPARTIAAIAAATSGVVWMFAHSVSFDLGARHAVGMLVALLVPIASAINLVTLARMHASVDMVPAVLIGGLLAAALMLPLALPLRATGTEIAMLAGLGCFQLALPCMLLVVAARRLSPPEVSLIALLEIVLGPLWTWLGAGEIPSRATLTGGAVVLAALIANEVVALAGQRAR